MKMNMIKLIKIIIVGAFTLSSLPGASCSMSCDEAISGDCGSTSSPPPEPSRATEGSPERSRGATSRGRACLRQARDDSDLLSFNLHPSSFVQCRVISILRPLATAYSAQEAGPYRILGSLSGLWDRLSYLARARLHRKRIEEMSRKLDEFNEEINEYLEDIKLNLPLAPELEIRTGRLPGKRKFEVVDSKTKIRVTFDLVDMNSMNDFINIYWDVIGDIYMPMVRGIYDNLARRIEVKKNIWRSHQQLIDEYRERLVKTFEIKPGERVLDIGTNIGTMALLAGEIVDLVIGIDISSESIRLARGQSRTLFNNTPKVQFSVQDATNCSYSDKSFDTIILQETLFALPSELRRRVLREANRMLVAGGRILIWAHHHQKNPLAWDMAEWKAELGETGFEIDAIEEIGWGISQLKMFRFMGKARLDSISIKARKIATAKRVPSKRIEHVDVRSYVDASNVKGVGSLKREQSVLNMLNAAA